MALGKSYNHYLKQHLKSYIIFGTIVLIVIIYIAMLFAPLLQKGIFYTINHFSEINPFQIIICKSTFTCVSIAVIAYLMALVVYFSTKRNTRYGEEDGSMRWASPQELSKKYGEPLYIDIPVSQLNAYGKKDLSAALPRSESTELSLHNPSALATSSDVVKSKKTVRMYNANNLIRSENYRQSAIARNPKSKNRHTMILGSSGVGKTYFVLNSILLNALHGLYDVQGNQVRTFPPGTVLRYDQIPDDMQKTSYVILDPKGEIQANFGHAFLNCGYKVRVLNLVDMSRSDGYNPLEYIECDNDIQILVTNIFESTGGTENKTQSNGDFWNNMAKVLLTALISYVYYFCDRSERNFSTVNELLRLCAVDEESGHKPTTEILMDEVRKLPAKDPRRITVKFFDDYRLANPGEGGDATVLANIQSTLASRLNKFNLDSVARLTETDMFELEKIGEERTVIFLCIDAFDSSFTFLATLFYNSLFQKLIRTAERKYNGRLPLEVSVIMEEAAQAKPPTGLDKLLSMVRSYNISITLVYQALAQLKTEFKEQWETIYSNCDHLMYLGGSEKDTHKFVSEFAGCETIIAENESQSKGSNGSFSKSMQNKGRELIKADEVRLLNHEDNNILIFVKDEYPLIDRKNDVQKHPCIKMTPIGNKDIPPYLHNELSFSGFTPYSKERLKTSLEETDFVSLGDELVFFTAEEINNQYMNALDEQQTSYVGKPGE